MNSKEFVKAVRFRMEREYRHSGFGNLIQNPPRDAGHKTFFTVNTLAAK
jgi:hypothetical protein